MPVRFEITDKRVISLNTDNDSLDFGRIMRGNIADKDITIINPFKTRVEVFVNFSGNISDFAKISENDFLLNVNEKRKLNLKIATSKDSVLEKYSGNLRVVINRRINF